MPADDESISRKHAIREFANIQEAAYFDRFRLRGSDFGRRHAVIREDTPCTDSAPFH